MSATPALVERSAAASSTTPTTILEGTRLLMARAAWAVGILIVIATFALGLHNSSLRHWFQVGDVERLAMLWLYILNDGILMFTAVVATVIIAWQKTDNWLALFISFMTLAFCASGTGTVRTLLVMDGLLPVAAHLVLALGLGSAGLFLFIFPTGRFVPRWTKVLTVLWLLFCASWVILQPWRMRALEVANFAPLTISTIVVYGTGVFAQMYRRKHVSTPVERQQTKWVAYGAVVAFVLFMFSIVGEFVFYPQVGRPEFDRPMLLLLLVPTLEALAIAALPIAIAISVQRARLWDIDPLIQRTLVYGMVTLGLGAFFVIEVIVFQRIFAALVGEQRDIPLILSTLAIVALYQPVRRRMQDMVDRRFYREKIDVQRAFTDFSREIRVIIDLPELYHVLVTRIMNLMHITFAAAFVKTEDGRFVRSDHHVIPGICTEEELPTLEKLEAMEQLNLPPDVLQRLVGGQTIGGRKGIPFNLLVPLIAPRDQGTELVGVLALGPRRSGQAYAREDQTLLSGLADQAGTAIYVARVIDEKQAEVSRREQIERQVEAWQNSPLGRAQTAASRLSESPETVISEIHAIAQKAGQDPDSYSLLTNLPKLIDEPKYAPVAKLAEGFFYLFNSINSPEVLPLGLRTITAQLSTEPGISWADSEYVLKLYGFALEQLGSQTYTQITQMLLELYEAFPDLKPVEGADNLPIEQQVRTHMPPPFLHKFGIAMLKLKRVAETLYASERVDNTRDKLGYMVKALEYLSATDRFARAELGAADSAVVQKIIQSWISITTGAMSDLQMRAQLVCRLLTRHTWQDDVVTLVLQVRNDGRGTAANLKVSLAPSPEYTAIDSAATVESLQPGEEAQVELKVRPRLGQGVDQFRARFIVQFSDPRGADQVENFADVVYLLKQGADFQFIPNPYVVGTPLQSGSPLFFGREDVVSFIQESLASAHRNNLVLIGQRRTGKTSLLKQLPARLGDRYLPVYLDGQALGLDPGMGAFFTALATEISFALEDRGFTAPALPDFSDSPASAFERVFLSAVRETIGDRHLLILFDEFEELETAVRRGTLDASIFGFLRHLIQHHANTSVIFCGTHRLEELGSDYWSVLFNLSLYRDIGLLAHTEAIRLVQEPVALYGMRYDDLALEKIWRVTAGHPYFLQLLCHSLVNRHNRTQRSYITVADVNAALDEILAAGEAHFVYLWAEATPQERLALTALSRIMLLTGQSTPVQVFDYLNERGIKVERTEISKAMHRLGMRDILSVHQGADSAGDSYRWQLGLISLWVEKYKSLSRVADEVRELA
ncbi:MAG: AAA family ATPase [Anaerolineae bacterium]|nr:AAA family ATPase [Anaerolineae bacterium]